MDSHSINLGRSVTKELVDLFERHVCRFWYEEEDPDDGNGSKGGEEKVGAEASAGNKRRCDQTDDLLSAAFGNRLTKLLTQLDMVDNAVPLARVSVECTSGGMVQGIGDQERPLPSI